MPFPELEKLGYVVGQQIGKGSFGTVYSAEHPSHPNMALAVKEIKVKDYEKGLPLDVISEINSYYITEGLPYIVRLLDVVASKNAAFLVYPRYDGDIHDLSQKLSFSQRQELFVPMYRQLLAGLYQIHQRGIYHSDIKTENFFYTLQKDGSYTFFYGDFGLAVRSLCYGVPAERIAYGGSDVFASQEFVQGKPINETSDAVSLAVAMIDFICNDDTYLSYKPKTESWNAADLIRTCKENKDEVNNFLYRHADIIEELTSFMNHNPARRLRLENSAYFDSISSKQRPLEYPNQDDLEIISGNLIIDLNYLRQDFINKPIEFVMAADCLFRIWVGYGFSEVDHKLLNLDNLSQVIAHLVMKLDSIPLARGVDEFEVPREMEALRLLTFLVGHCNQDALILATTGHTTSVICDAMVAQLRENVPFYLNYRQFVDYL